MRPYASMNATPPSGATAALLGCMPTVVAGYPSPPFDPPSTVMMSPPPAGMTVFEAGDGDPSPALFLARTVNTYGVPSASPGNVVDVTTPTSWVAPPGLAVS